MKSRGAIDTALDLTAKGLSLTVVVSRFNPTITDGLLAGAVQAFTELGGVEADLKIVYVPGAFELPQMAQRMAQVDGIDGLLTLGALVQGETLHFEVLAYGVTQTLTELSTRLPVPMSFGLLTALTIKQAEERSQPGKNNRGADVMRSLIEMVMLVKETS